MHPSQRCPKSEEIQRVSEQQAKRQEVAAQKANNPGRAGGVDPDLEGIQAGPQPLQDWQTDVEAETEAETK